MTKRSKTGKLSYADSGVSIEEGDALVKRLARKNKHIGGFSGAWPLATKGMRKPVLLASTDGVGTKLLVAQRAGKLDTIGIDLVAMVVNDLIVSGAKPLFFLDYYATGKLNAKESDAILRGISRGCEEAGIPLLGGETAEMPGVYEPGHFDLAGFGVAIADGAKMVDGSKVKPGNAIIGVASSGIHSNGYSLVRAAAKRARLDMKKEYGLGASLEDVLLAPTRIYVRAVAAMMEDVRPLAMSHITGGGLPGNLVRVLPKDCMATIDARSWEAPAVFGLLREKGDIERDEMFRVFNMGIGYAIVVPKTKAKRAIAILEAQGERAWTIGEIRKGRRGVRIGNGDA